MSSITLINASCADQTADAVVNAANDGLWAGSGICGVIFQKAGKAALAAACSQYKTPLKDGSAVITPAFQMKNAKYIIHALKERGRIFDILDSHRTQEAQPGEREAYYPVSIYCPCCGKDTTKITALSENCEEAEYTCACGHSGHFNFTKDFNIALY